LIKQNAIAMTTLEFSYSLQKLSSSLKPFAMKLTRDVDDANDLLQDTMVKAFTNFKSFLAHLSPSP